MSTTDDSVFVFENDKERENCLLAVPKKGRLYERCLALLQGAGLDHHRPPRLDIAHCTTLPVTIVFLPASDIATYVGEGNVDVGITGLDVVEESEVNVDRIMDLGFGKCSLCVQAPVTSGFSDSSDLAGKRIVTSFPNLARKHFAKYDTEGLSTRIKYVSGSVEAACGLGLADAVVDLVETGTTMKAAGLHVISEVLQTQAVMISSKMSKHPDVVDLIRKRIQGYITATSYMMISYNACKRLLPACLKITPGKRAATVSPLEPLPGEPEEDQAVAVSALVLKKESSKIMDQVEQAGATDILLLSISNSRM